MSEILSQFIDGQSYVAQGAAKKFLSPWDQSLLATWNDSEELDVIKTIQAGKKFLSRPTGWPREEREQLLMRTKSVIEANAQNWALEEALAQGLPEKFVLENSLLHSLGLIDSNLQSLKVDSGFTLSPTGLIAIITSWNLSFRLVMEAVIPALGAGNAVIVKISSQSPTTAKILRELATQAEWPAGSVGVLLGEGERVGQFLASHPGVRAVSFVGKPKNAECVIKATATQFKKLKIRSGTKNAALVLPSVDEIHIPEIINSFLLGSGQLGWGMTRLLTLESEASPLTEKIKNYLRTLTPATSPKDSSPLGPLSKKNKFEELKLKAVAEHGKILDDSKEASFLLDLPNCSDLQQEELQVPLFPIVTVKYAHELAKWANNTSFGFLATIWGDPEKARKLCEKL